MEKLKEKKGPSSKKSRFNYKMQVSYYPGDNQPNLLMGTFPIKKHQHDSLKRQLIMNRKRLKIYALPFWQRVGYLFKKTYDYGFEVINLDSRNLYSFRVYAEKQSDAKLLFDNGPQLNFFGFGH